jgi:hypothetical protein
VIEVLGHQHLRQQSGGRDALVDDVRRHRRLDEFLAAGADPLAAHVPLDGKHAGLVVELLGHVLADALHGLAAAAGGVLRFVANLAAWQVHRQLLALGVLPVWPGRLVNFDLGRERGQVGIQRLFDQALLLGAVGLGLRGELQPLEHGHLVRELVDQRALVMQLDSQPLHCLAQLGLIESVEVVRGDHGA